MPDRNQTLARIFDQMGDALEIKGENVFKIAAYRKVARVLRDLPRDVAEIAAEQKLREIPGVGPDLAAKMEEFLATGQVAAIAKEVAALPTGLFDILRIPDVGPKTVKLVYEKIGVKTLEEFKKALETGVVAELPGMGEKKVAKILKGMEFVEKAGERLALGQALPVAEHILAALEEVSGVKKIEAAGSLRRWKETVGDIDLVSATGHPEKLLKEFTELKGVSEVRALGDTKASIRFEDQVQVQLRVVEPESWGAALAYFTGSKEHNVRLRTLALKHGLSLNEYGFLKGEKRIPVGSEEQLYEKLKMPYVPPELREDSGEVEAALAHTLPPLVEPEDIRGDLHVHTRHSDGLLSVEEVVTHALDLGYEYIAITDHSQSAQYAHGLEPERLKDQWKDIDEAQKKHPRIRIFKGAEVDIRPDGEPDYPDELLKRFEFVLVAIHQWGTKDVTGRVVRALSNPFVTGMAHPTGRLIGKREPYLVDLHRVMETAAEKGKWMEINSHYMRLDLNDAHAREARKLGIRISLGTDTHAAGEFANMRYGVHTARRAWLTPDDLVNCLPLAKIERLLCR